MYRLFCLQSHYRKSLVFSYENLDNAATTCAEAHRSRIAALKPEAGEAFDEAAAETLRAKFNEALGNDLNTSLGVTVLYDVLKFGTNAATKLALLGEFDAVLGLSLLPAAERARAEAERLAKAETQATVVSEGEPNTEAEALALARIEARKAKDWARADELARSA